MEVEVEETQFSIDELTIMLREAVEKTLARESYKTERIRHQVEAVCEACLQALTKLQRPFKYVVHCTVSQNSGAAMFSSYTTYWDNAKDNTCTVQWKNDTILCIVSVFGFSVLHYQPPQTAPPPEQGKPAS